MTQLLSLVGTDYPQTLNCGFLSLGNQTLLFPTHLSHWLLQALAILLTFRHRWRDRDGQTNSRHQSARHHPKGPWHRSLNSHLGRQYWAFDQNLGTAEERAQVEKVRREFHENRFHAKHSSDLLMRLQVTIEFWLLYLFYLSATQLLFYLTDWDWDWDWDWGIKLKSSWLRV